jgi:hypothetical protein
MAARITLVDIEKTLFILDRLKKLPGIQIDKDGNVTMQGQKSIR